LDVFAVLISADPSWFSKEQRQIFVVNLILSSLSEDLKLITSGG
jgi:hypothetical protein